MLQAKMTAPYTVVFSDVAIPDITPDQVLLKIKKLGVCGSDVQIYQGKHQYVKFPLVTGHEVAAEIVKVGVGVSGFRLGDKVAVQPQIVCGTCHSCKTGHMNVCESLKVIGVHCDGMACQFYAIDPCHLHLCNELREDEIVLAEPVAVAMGCIRRVGCVKGQNLAVVGAGPIGILVAQCAKAMGADVILVDVVDERLEYAKKIGIQRSRHTGDRKLKEIIRDEFGDRGADTIIDCAATKSSFESILDAARCYSQIVVTGNFKEPTELFLPRIQRQEISILGHMMYTREDFQKALEFLRNRSICLDGFITRRFCAREYDKAFDYVVHHPAGTMKVVVEFPD